ncbi:MAG: hypothetical protein IJ225_06980 [Solobacterium sp.]|nr:hypothetical protein [Solobacterium sp.]
MKETISITKPNLTIKEKENILYTIGQKYRETRLRLNLAESEQPYSLSGIGFRYDRQYLHRIDESLRVCTIRTQLIIRNEFLEISEDHWYETYFTSYAWVRERRKAVLEFFAVLDLGTN